MGSTAWAGVLMVVVAVVIAAAFILLWMRDKDRADEVADDPQRAETGQRQGPADVKGNVPEQVSGRNGERQ
jgi:hypothetical protein